MRHARGTIAGVQRAVPLQSKACMHDSVQRVFRRLLGHRRLAEGQHVKLAAEYFRVKAHRISAVAVEGQIGNGLWHGGLLCGVV